MYICMVTQIKNEKNNMLIFLSILSFLFSFVFALGGIGAAIVLVPVLYSLGIPLSQAKPIGLLYNTVSLSGASYLNIRDKRLNFKLGMPIIVFSLVFAPVGAFCSKFIPHTIVLIIFIVFLIFSATVMWFFKSSEYSENFRQDKPVIQLSVLGVAVGVISGLLGVGGGGLISPVMILMGFNPKKVAAITAFTVPFSSFTGFLTYFAMGSINFKILIVVTLFGFLGAYTGTNLMQKRFKPESVKKILGVILVLLALKMIWKLF